MVISPEVLTIILVVSVPVIVQALRLFGKYVLKQPVGGDVARWVVFGVSVAVAGFLYNQTGAFISLPHFPVMSGPPDVVANALLAFVTAWSAVLISLYNTSTFLYDKLLRAVFEKIRAA